MLLGLDPAAGHTQVVCELLLMDRSQWRKERMALEKWRNAFVAYLDSEPDYAEDFPKAVADTTLMAAKPSRLPVAM